MDTIFYRGEQVIARVAGQQSLDWLELDDISGLSVEHVITADDVRAEAERRMMLVVGARDAGHLQITLANGAREGLRLLAKGPESWTEHEAQRARLLEAVDTRIEAIRAASNAMEPAPPKDYAENSHWPAS